jgi:hypothetical protein
VVPIIAGASGRNSRPAGRSPTPERCGASAGRDEAHDGLGDAAPARKAVTSGGPSKGTRSGRPRGGRPLPPRGAGEWVSKHDAAPER